MRVVPFRMVVAITFAAYFLGIAVGVLWGIVFL